MKILYLMTEPFGIGGVQSDILTLSEDLTKKGHEVYVATTEGELLEELKSKGAMFLDVNFQFNGLGEFWRAVKELRNAIKEHNIEVLAPQSVRSTIASFVGLRMMPFSYKVPATRKRLPIVTTIHNIHNPMHFKYGGIILNTCSDYVIFESHYERDRLLKSGLGAHKSSVIHSGIDTLKFKPREPDQELLERYNLDYEKNKIFGIVARHSEEKGHKYLLQAFKSVVAELPEARLLIVGDGPLRNEIEAQVDELGLREFVILTGTQREVHRFLSVFHSFVLSSTRESFPLAAREAMAAGRSVIAPRIGGCPEVVEENHTGYLFEAANIQDLSEKMKAIVRDAKYVGFGQKSRERVEKYFSRIQWVEGDEKVYLGYC